VACRSQDNPRHIVPDGVPLGVANLGFRRASCPRQLDRPPRRLDRPVLGGSASGFPTTARSSAFMCLIEKSVNTHFYVFGSGVKHGVFGNTNGTRAITHERYMGTLLTKVTQHICDPKQL
jgi:hypothetical protein